MKVKVLKSFIDLSEGVERKAGDVFECTKERFEEIKAKLPEWVISVEEPKTTSSKAKTKATAKRTTKE